jgi:signal transduction histidine kinase
MVCDGPYEGLRMSHVWRNRELEVEALPSTNNDLALAVEAGRLGCWILDFATGQISCNSACRASLRLSADSDWSLATFTHHIHADDRGRFNEALEQALRENAECDIELRTAAAAGATRWVLIRGRIERDEDGLPLRMAGTILDITNWKQTENALRLADRRKDELIATLAHELRNSLAAVRCAVTVLKMSDDESNRKSATDTIDRQVNRFIRLIDDLLDVNRIKTGVMRLKKELIDAGATIALAIEDVQPLLDEKKHELVVSIDGDGLPVHADPARLEQIILNLLSNAAKYTDPGGRITLKAATDGQQVTIRVGDNGIGIPPETLLEIFEPFKRGDLALDGSAGGLGVGLAVAAQLTEMQGGTLLAASEGAGSGSEFILRLPDARRLREGGGLQGAVDGPAERIPDILSVEDADKTGAVVSAATTEA